MTERIIGPSGSRRRRRWLALPFALALAAVLVFTLGASADTLPGSSFEIDDPGGNVGANLILDAGPGTLDWDTVNEIRTTDTPSGQNDDSYSGGEKEDDACPSAGTGSIPNNKSDLLAFGGFKENVAGSPGYLHVFWTRVQDPSGTTNLDFEFNKSTTDCDGAGPSKNVTRTVGDILLQFDVDKGGKVAELSRRTWNGTAWSDPPVDLDATGGAIGSINQVTIPDAESDGLGARDPRTFGEASFDLSRVFDPTVCESFGSAMLKSRSSDQFNSALKDFIAPIPININNCATVIIRKQTIPDGETQTFGFTKSYATIPATANTFTLADNGVFSNQASLANNLTVSEDAVTATGWVFDNVNCNVAANPSVGVTPVIAGQQVTFSLDANADVLDCTFTNRKQLGAIQVTKTRKHAAGGGTVPHPGVTFTIAGQTAVTNALGVACIDGLAFSATGYAVTETVPANYVADGATTKTVVVDHNATCAAGNGNAVAFSNTPLTDVSISIDSLEPGGTASTVNCDNGASGATGAGGDGTVVVANDAQPATIVCTIVVDP